MKNLTPNTDAHLSEHKGLHIGDEISSQQPLTCVDSKGVKDSLMVRVLVPREPSPCA